MIAALLLAQASAVDAERAFAVDARKLGQWTAFRAYAAENAVMFDPQPVNARWSLTDKKDPPRSVEWRPAHSFVSCDGMTAANTGPWRAGGHGYFSTIWAKQPDGAWRWLVDGGDVTKTPKFAWDAEPEVRMASCTPAQRMVFVPIRGAEDGASPDGSLAWRYVVRRNGARDFTVWLWNGRAFEKVIDDKVAAPPSRPAQAAFLNP